MLKGERTILRPMRRDYLERLLEFHNDVELQLLGGEDVPVPLTPEHLAERFQTLYAGQSPRPSWFAIEVQGGKIIGHCMLRNIDEAARTAELRITIGDRDYVNRKYGRDVVRLLVKYAFRLRNLRKIWLAVPASNERARRCFEAAGFTVEGVQRAHTWVDGRYDDRILMAAFREQPAEAPPPAPEEPSPNAEDVP
ncbi:MAG: N-acetyltransferase [Tepidiforma sp.]|nr:MAG: N-acetyltransferase [Tepidiforma sp.]